MLLIVDLLVSLVDAAVTSLGIRRANWVSFAVCVLIGVCCLGGGSPGWAALAFATAAVDGWTLRQGGYSDENEGTDG
ncbi:MAG: hypothetical protein V4479_07550 [Actinomycetota bacterium]